MGNMQEGMTEAVPATPENFALKSELALRRTRMDRLGQLRASHREAIEAELRASDAGRCLLRDAQRLDGLMRHAATALHEGQLTRADALALVTRAQADYRERHGELLVATRARHAASDASAAHMAAVLLGTDTSAWVIEGGAHGPTRFGPTDRPAGGGSGEDPGEGPAPAPAPLPPVLDQTVGAPYDLPPSTSIWSSGLTAQQPEASASAATGRCMVNAWGFGVIVTGGGSVCRALVGNSFTLPAQTTQLDITADISIDADILAIAVLGAAGGGLDYWLRVDPGDGSGVTERSVAAGQVIAPILWTAEWKATVQLRIAARIGVQAGPVRTAQVLAGVNAHAEAGGLDCGAFSLGFANVRSIRLIAR